MALETLKGIVEIDGEKVLDLDLSKTDTAFFNENGEFDWKKYDEHRKDSPISVCHSENMVSFKIQKGPIKEFGKNGCQVDALISTARIIIGKLNENYPCKENDTAILHLGLALKALEARKKDREARGVKGLNAR